MAQARITFIALGLLIAACAQALAAHACVAGAYIATHTAVGASWIANQCDALRARIEAA